MSPSQTGLVAVVTTGAGATVLAAFTATLEAVTQLAVGFAAVVASGVGLLLLWWTPWFRALPPERQQRAMWVTTGIIGFIVCCLPLVIILLRR